MQATLQQFNSETLHVNDPMVLENGEVLEDLRIHYTTYGQLNEDQSNVVWVFHALTANSEAADWWPGLVGEGCFINPEEHFIICANMIGSCYGSLEPENFDFPLLTISDMTAANKRLLNSLNISRIKIGIGGSMGGQQLLEWAVQEPDLFEVIIPIATNAKHSPWGIAFNETQRMALEHPDSAKGLEIARAIAMLSYRHYDTYDSTQLDLDGRSNHFSASSYQRYQGEKLEKRFSPISYHYLSKAMDSHNVGRHLGGLESALGRINSRCIVIGIETDILFPISEQEFIAVHIPGAQFQTISSDYGHDGFLIEVEKISNILKEELK